MTDDQDTPETETEMDDQETQAETEAQAPEPTFVMQVPVHLEAREAMYEELAREFGEEEVKGAIQQAVAVQGNEAATQQVANLYDNRDNLRSQAAQQ